MAKNKKKQRHGVGLSIWLVLLGLMNLLTLVLIMGTAKGPDTFSYPYLMAGLLIFSAAKIVAIIAIWFWERWGLYVYAISVIGTMAVGLMLTGTWLYAFNEILPLAILGWLLKDKYDKFD